MEELARLYPEVRDPPPEDTFEIAIVLAGAVSAGAYTAGVMDFLTETLDAWYAARQDPAADVPRHHVRVRMACGSSAGGMNGAILASAARYDFPHVRINTGAGDQAANPFYRAWVKQVDIRPLLDTRDMDTGKPEAVLNCALLDTIAAGIIGFAGKPADPRRRAWLDDPFRLSLTVSNLRGVPYSVSFRGSQGIHHDMAMHADSVSFEVPVFAAPVEAPPDTLGLPLDKAAPEWRLLQESALATGAFPLALKPRALYRDTGQYFFRDIAIVDNVAVYSRTIDERRWDFLNVDGGMMDNEPFEMGRVYLAGSKGHNPREGDAANRAVIMIDPFPDTPKDGPGAFTSLLEIAGSILDAFKTQARFKHDDLALMQDNIVYSRFIIAPDRGKEGRGKKLQVASGGLGAFFGFFAEAIRRHDYLLGRANCQSFLRNWFTLPENNKLMAGAWNAHIQRRDTYAQNEDYRGTHEYQIIPLVGAVRQREVQEPWPATAFKGYEELRTLIENRVDRLYKAAVAHLGWGAKLYLKLGWKFEVRKMLLDKVRDAVDAAAKELRDDP